MSIRENRPVDPLDYITSRLASFAKMHDVDPTPIMPSSWTDIHSIIHVSRQTESFDTVIAKTIPKVLGHIAMWRTGERLHATVRDTGVEWLGLMGLKYNSPEIKSIVNIFGEGTRIPEPKRSIHESPYPNPSSSLKIQPVLHARYQIPLVEVNGYTLGVHSGKAYEHVDEMPEDVSQADFNSTQITFNFPPTPGKARII